MAGIRIRPHDAPRDDLTAVLTPPSGGVDLLMDQAGWLYRTYAVPPDVLVERSRNAGISWELTDTILSAVVDATAAPALERSHRDEIFLCFHNTSGETKIYRSDAAGESFVSVQTVTGLTHPRLCTLGPWRQLLAGVSGTDLLIFKSHDYYLARDSMGAGTAIATIAARRPEIRVDRQEFVHVVYERAGAIRHRQSEDAGDSWGGEATPVAVGTYPSYHVGANFGMYVWWDGADFRSEVTEEDYSTPDRAPVTITGSWATTQPGLIWSPVRDDLYLLLRASGGALSTRYSGAEGEDVWPVPV